jgi:hypothetical protein
MTITLIGLSLIFIAWAYQFLASFRGIDAPSRAPRSLFVLLYMAGVGVLVYDAFNTHDFLVGYLNLAALLAALGVFVQSFKR